MTSDFQKAFSPDAPRELVEQINERCARAEVVEGYVRCIECGGKGYRDDWEGGTEGCDGCETTGLEPNQLADYIGDHRNALRLRERAIAVPGENELGQSGYGYWLLALSGKMASTHINELTEASACAPVWAMCESACLVLEGGK